MQMGGGNFESNGSVQKLDRGEACTTVQTYSETHYTVYLKWVSCAVYKFYLKLLNKKDCTNIHKYKTFKPSCNSSIHTTQTTHEQVIMT